MRTQHNKKKKISSQITTIYCYHHSTSQPHRYSPIMVRPSKLRRTTDYSYAISLFFLTRIVSEKQSKRVPVRLRHKIEKRSAEKQRKERKHAKKHPELHRKKKPAALNIPNSFPYKDRILSEIEEARRVQAEEQAKRKEEAKRRREEKLGGGGTDGDGDEDMLEDAGTEVDGEQEEAEDHDGMDFSDSDDAEVDIVFIFVFLFSLADV